jgi:hypothetical protein
MSFKLKISLFIIILLPVTYILFVNTNLQKELIPEWYVEESLMEQGSSQSSEEQIVSPYSFSALNKNGFSYFNNETKENSKCSYLKKLSSGADSFPINFFICEIGFSYDYFFPLPNISDKNIQKFHLLGFPGVGFKFNNAKTFNQILNSNENNKIVFEYDKKYIDPLTSEGNLSFSGLVDKVYKGDLVIKNHVFELNPDMTLFDTPLKEKIGPLANSLISSKAAGASLGCVVGGAIGAGVGALIDIFAFGATLGTASVAGAGAGCMLGRSVGSTGSPDLDERLYCSIYRDNSRQDYAVCQRWHKDMKIRSHKFHGALNWPIVARIIRYEDHLEIDFIDDRQKVSFLL